MRHLLVRGAIAFVLILGCKGRGNGDDTGDDAEALELYGISGAAVVDTTANTYVGNTIVYDQVHENGGGAYSIGDSLCEMVFSASEDTTNKFPALECTGCSFGFNVKHQSLVSRTGPLCETLWPTGNPGLNPSFWDMGIGYHPTYYGGGPAVMLYFTAYTDDGGTYHEAEWIGYPNADEPAGYANFNSGNGDFIWDWPIYVFPY
jgi:hypothetical protein